MCRLFFCQRKSTELTIPNRRIAIKVKVLIADDEQEFSQTLAQRLELRGFAVTDVYSGQSALDVLEKIDIDVALLDVQMPEISGIDVLKIIKENKPLIQVIMLTGAGTIKIAIEGMKLGAYDFLLKPAEIDVLEEKINEANAIRQRHVERIRQAEIDNILNRCGW